MMTWWMWVSFLVVGLVLFLGGAVIAVVAFRLGVQAARNEPLTIRQKPGRCYMKTEEDEAKTFDRITGADKAKQKMMAQALDEAEKTP